MACSFHRLPDHPLSERRGARLDHGEVTLGDVGQALEIGDAVARQGHSQLGADATDFGELMGGVGVVEDHHELRIGSRRPLAVVPVLVPLFEQFGDDALGGRQAHSGTVRAGDERGKSRLEVAYPCPGRLLDPTSPDEKPIGSPITRPIPSEIGSRLMAPLTLPGGHDRWQAATPCD